MSPKHYPAFKPNALYLACLTILSIKSQMGLAQETTPNIEEVLVSAQMRSEGVQSVPIAIGVYDKDLIATAGANSLSDLEFAIPNLNFGSGARNTRGEIAIRGIGGYTRNIGTDARVAVYVDGVLTGRSSSFDQNLLDVDHIEVLRGPQGTLAGTNALAGSINIITQKPENKFSSEILSEAGNYNLRSISGKINAPLSPDLYASIIAGTTQQDGYIHNITLNRDLQGTNNDTVKLKLRYVGIESLTLDLSFDYLNDDNKSTNAEALENGKFNGFTVAPAPYIVAHNVDEYSKRRLTGTNITATYLTPENFTLVSITGIRSSKFIEQNEEDYSPLDVAGSLFDEDSDQVSQEFRLVSPKNETFDYIIGTYFFDQDLSTQRSATGGALFPVPFGVVKTPATAEDKSASIYMHGNYYFADNWEISSGIRYIQEKKSIDYSSIDTLSLFINANHVKDEKTYNEFLPKVGIDYHPSTNTLIYTSVSRGYKSGGWNADFIKTLENFQFNPEFALNYELGIKSSWLDNKITMNTSSFITKIHDFQVFQFIPTSTGTILSLTNAGKVTSEGLEVDLSTKLTSHLTANANAALTRAEFDEFKNGGGLGVDYDKRYLPFAPEHAYYLGLDYTNTLSNQINFYGHIDYSYTGKYFSNPDNISSNSIKEYHLSNARIGIKIDATWDISLWVKNLTNETNLRQRSVSFLGVPRGFYDPPRYYGLTAKYNFN